MKIRFWRYLYEIILWSNLLTLNIQIFSRKSQQNDARLRCSLYLSLNNSYPLQYNWVSKNQAFFQKCSGILLFLPGIKHNQSLFYFFHQDPLTLRYKMGWAKI